MSCLQKIFLSIFVLLIISHPAHSQREDTTKIYNLKGVTVVADRYARMIKFSEIAAKIPMTLQETPASIGIVTQQTLKDQNATVLSDALENISGVNIQSSLGTQDYFFIRGFESSSAGLILTDGARDPNESLFKFYGFGFYDLYNVDQVEVLKGPAAFLYGGNTLSGAINLVRKAPLFRSFAEVSLSHSRFQSYRETIDVEFVQPDSIYSCRINGLWQNTGKFRSHTRNKNYAFNPTVTWNLKKYGAITLNVEYIRSDIKPDMGIPLYMPKQTWQLPNVSRKTSYQTPFDELVYDRLRLRLDYTRDISRSAQLRNKFYATYLNGNSRFTLAHIPYRDMIGNWIFGRHIYSFAESQPNIGNQLEFCFSFSKNKIMHKLLFGLESALFTNKSVEWTTLLSTIYLLDPYDPIRDFDQLTTFHTRIKTHARNFILAPYVVDFISFSDKLQLFCGGRLDYIDFHTDRRNAPFDFVGRSLSSTPIPFSKTYLKFSPMLGLVIKDSESLWFYINAGQSFASGVRVMDEPEKSSQFEIGYKYATLNDRVRASGAIFRLKKENLSIPLTGPLQGDKYISSGSQLSLGLELDIIAQPITNLYLFLSYSSIDAELIKYRALTADKDGKLTVAEFSGKVPTFVPAQIANLWITKVFQNDLTCGMGMRFVGNQYVNLENTFRATNYLTYNAMAAYKFRNYRLRINFDNLTGSEFLTRGLGPFSVIPAGSFVVYGSLDVML
ncbi:MAG: TonB-dependent receptor plug domain-containing protein [bacterium]|nr:TonB-dependent receptor plug domain-containing protein [bacterium]